ncbi:hypothetical protein Agabi119p4_983 [Agaricus bisporus var. burnettii]|uniref:histone acetyltransferase n=1 Tax=Agaricus bisporus var. burnettii TaxID=192524 RepID=A0A8H7FC42_AGABI|nr:hypothetical protein AGABI2DRAFT_190087 [Agaricus bisporus var. bisporus H97]EKV51877.1 hypothetical protein AGABI2DRAFT_190087 [Agaricus bisporus var. bisporus H97]KAF7784818.1 hypothetical protein Agabi119p4_983 [Agaricus bisporus var. burnettii]
MPALSLPQSTYDPRIYVIDKGDTQKYVQVLERSKGQVYVHYINQDKRLDEWIDERDCRPAEDMSERRDGRSRKRKRHTSASSGLGSHSDDTLPLHEEDVPLTEEEIDLQTHKQITAQRNFETVHFGNWQIKTWYFSPYPLTDEEEVSQPSTGTGPRIPGVARTTARSHGRTVDILAGGLHRYHSDGQRADLYVCDMCFKYMADPASWELHKKQCEVKHPPGRKVYQRGSQTIWEVDGSIQKLYCQNLALFGKLFIDVKTLFFDCDNFLFYILTDALPTCDIMLGFFSKEKISYDGYNLACIMTLPPYQRQGYGSMMIEFSYELSRRSGKVGTPERPLSDLGLRSYLAFWVARIIRYFRRVLSALPPEIPRIRTVGDLPNLSKSSIGELEDTSKRKKRMKGRDGELVDPVKSASPLITFDDPTFTVNRVFEIVQREDGAAEIHVSVHCTLNDIARATNLRIEDAAFALNECGLLMRRLTRSDENETIVVTRELVEKVAEERKVKIAVLSLNHVLLDND